MSSHQVIVSKRLIDSNDPLLDSIQKTYNSSFPPEERRDFSLIRGYVSSKPYFEIHVLLCEGKYVGFITSWNLDDFIYIEHFAIDESFRNGGIGAQGMTSFLKGQLLPVVLEVELPTDSLSKRRIGFYERLGFVLDDHVYIQPKYHPEDEALELRLMTFGPIDLTKSFDTVAKSIHQTAYDCK